MTSIEDRIEAARRQADAAQAKFAAISRQALSVFLNLSHRRALTSLDDPQLTPADKADLHAHLQKQLPTRPMKVGPSSRSFAPMLKAVCDWAIRYPSLLVSIVALVIVGGFSLANTPLTIGLGRIVSNLDVRWQDGSLQKLDGIYAVIGQSGTDWLLRVWRPSKGYELVRLPYDSIVAAR